MTAFSWLMLLYVVIFFLLARYLIPPHQRGNLMTVGAVVFILMQNPPHAVLRFLFIFITFATLFGGWVAGKKIAKQTVEISKTFWVGSLIFLLGPLVTFKLVQTIIPVHLLDVARASRANIDIGSLAPLGISYFTFRALAYLIELRRGTIKPVDWWRYLNYVAFWPTFMAGPIERPDAFFQQDLKETVIASEDIRIGVMRIAEGMFKKLVLSAIFYHVAKPFMLLQGLKAGERIENFTTWQLWVCLTAYYLYLYFDFAGYSDVAIGAARLFGYRIMENFKWPILATNVAEFWRRWHISLTSWITDYVYIALGGNRKGLGNAAKYTVIAMVLVGVWHGLSLHFALWGLYHALFLNLYRSYRKTTPKEAIRSRRQQFVAWFLTFQIVNLGWVLFLFKPKVALAIYMKLFLLS